MPEARHDGSTSVPGVYVVGDLTGIPLLKFSLDTGARAVERVAAELDAERSPASNGLLDLAIVGAGVSGVAAAIEAKRRGLTFTLLEAREPFSTIVDFPKAKPIYTYPRSMKPAGSLQVEATVKEALVDELRSQADKAGVKAVPFDVERLERLKGEIRVHGANGEPLRARRVIVAIGRSGSYRALGVPGEERDASITGSTTRTTSPARTCSWWAAGTRPSRPPSRSRRRGDASRSRTGRRSSRAPSRRTGIGSSGFSMIPTLT